MKLDYANPIAPMVSIVLPTYNPNPESLIRAVASCLNQSFSDFELLIVDDGSPIGSKKVFDDIASTDRRVSVISAKHGGVSRARNAGIELSKGKYICFIDDDDELDLFFLEEAIQYIFANGLSAVFGSQKRITPKSPRSIKQRGSNDGLTILSGNAIEALSDYFFSYQPMRGSGIPDWIPNGPVAKVFSKELIEQVRFNPSLRWSEDGLFLSEATLSLLSVGLVNRTWYYYYQNAASAMHNLRLDGHMSDYCAVMKEQAVRLGKASQLYYSNVTVHFFSALEHMYEADKRFPLEAIEDCLQEREVKEAFFYFDEELFELPIYKKIKYYALKKRCFSLLKAFFFLKRVKRGTVNK